MSEPKRWWIAPKLYSPADPVEAEFYIAYDQKGASDRLEIETIEASDYDKLAEKLKLVIQAKDNAIDQANAYKTAGEQLIKRLEETAKQLALTESKMQWFKNKSIDRLDQIVDAEEALEMYADETAYEKLVSGANPDGSWKSTKPSYVELDKGKRAREYFEKHRVIK